MLASPHITQAAVEKPPTGAPLDYQLEIFNNLKKAAGSRVSHVTLKVDWDTEYLDASYWIQQNIVSISRAEMSFSKFDRDEIAFTLGHELGHALIRYNDPTLFRRCLNSNKENKKCEILADILGQILMYKAGYDMCKADDYWIRKIRFYGDPLQTSHPQREDRIKYLNCKTGPAKEYIDWVKLPRKELKKELWQRY